MTGSRLEVAVVGGGIGGLFAATALRARGIAAEVYEQAPALSEIGAGVQLTPNSVRQLQRLGLGPDVARCGAPNSTRSQYLRHDGTPVAPITTTDSAGWNAVMGMHRADLIEMLARQLPEHVVHTGHRAIGFEQDADGARLRFDTGVSVEADVVVAADGIHSLLQQYVIEPSAPLYSGSVAYRGLVPQERLPWWPKDEIQLWMGAGKHFLVYPVRAGEMINYVGFIPADESLAESWSTPGDPGVLAREFAGWDPRIEQLMAEVDVVYGWGLYDREPLSRWTEGRLTLLGDAAHPMLPHVGQGANQAMEDGMALATFLHRMPERPREALTAYERLRRERTDAVQRGARDTGLRYDSAYKDLTVRDAELAASQQFRWWIYDYDVLEEAERLSATL
jgi:2-polyprenyl-6-methoxyphenol hydroxylase-like FAD-dependent oxidoreductase